MGPRLKLPKYVHGFLDRHGVPRFYYRRPGFAAVKLPGLPYSPEFMASYMSAIGGQSLPVGAAKVMPRTMRAVALSYFAAPGFTALRPSTRHVYRLAIERFCRAHGDKRASELRHEHVVRLMGARAERPNAANALRILLRVLMRHAVEIGMRADDPTVGIRRVPVHSRGHHSWADDEISRFERCHPIGTQARLVLALLLHTGQRRGDIIGLGPQHIRNGAIHITQEKTGVALEIPVHPELAVVIAATPSGHLTFLTTKQGRPFKPEAFSHWFRDRCDEAGLPHCSAHGLRKAAARRLAEAGCTAHEIAAITGHATLSELVRYTRAVDQRRLAEAAVAKTRTKTRKLSPRFAKKAKKR